MTTTPASLPSLLWSALNGLERAFAACGAATQMPSLDLWANLLRTLTHDGTATRDLPRMLSLSKRAVRTRAATVVRHGWAEEAKLGRGQTILRLTAPGSAMATRWKSLQSAAEQHWTSQVGAEPAAQLRSALQPIVAAFPLEHPHYPASYGPVDASITGGNGEDWKPVPRAAGDTVSHLALYALLSQAIVEYAMNYEQLSPVALSLSAAVIRRIPPAGIPVRELGHSIGVSALTRHGFLRLVGSAPAQIAFLTAKGEAVARAFPQRIAAVEADWPHRFGPQPVAALRRVLEEIAAV